MTTTTEPRVTFKKEARTIEVAYFIGTDEGTRGAERRHYAVLSIGYDKGGMNYFSGRTTPRSYRSSINRITEEDSILDGRKIGTVTGFKLFDGLGLLRSDPVKRYSEKALHEFAKTAREHFETVRHDERVARYFEPVEAA